MERVFIGHNSSSPGLGRRHGLDQSLLSQEKGNEGGQPHGVRCRIFRMDLNEVACRRILRIRRGKSGKMGAPRGGVSSHISGVPDNENNEVPDPQGIRNGVGLTVSLDSTTPMSRPILIIHGWSDTSDSFVPLARLRKSMVGRLFKGWKWDGSFETGKRTLYGSGSDNEIF